MYLSHLLIDAGDNPDRPQPGRRWLRNLYHVHQRLCMAFPSAERKAGDADFLKPFRPEDFGENQVQVPRGANHGFLFRIDPRTGGRAVILVQSAVKPNWEYAFHNAGFLLAAQPEVRPFVPDFTRGRSSRFRLVANPTRKIDTKTGPDGKKNNGRRVPVRDEQLFGWLVRRAETSGFCVVEESTTIQPGYIYMKKPNGIGQRLRTARYEGVLTVTDADRFAKALVGGIGPGKAFGFGLLSIAPG